MGNYESWPFPWIHHYAQKRLQDIVQCKDDSAIYCLKNNNKKITLQSICPKNVSISSSNMKTELTPIYHRFSTDAATFSLRDCSWCSCSWRENQFIMNTDGGGVWLHWGCTLLRMALPSPLESCFLKLLFWNPQIPLVCHPGQFLLEYVLPLSLLFDNFFPLRMFPNNFPWYINDEAVCLSYSVMNYW